MKCETIILSLFRRIHWMFNFIYCTEFTQSSHDVQLYCFTLAVHPIEELFKSNNKFIPRSKDKEILNTLTIDIYLYGYAFDVYILCIESFNKRIIFLYCYI